MAIAHKLCCTSTSYKQVDSCSRSDEWRIIDCMPCTCLRTQTAYDLHNNMCIAEVDTVMVGCCCPSDSIYCEIWTRVWLYAGHSLHAIVLVTATCAIDKLIKAVLELKVGILTWKTVAVDAIQHSTNPHRLTCSTLTSHLLQDQLAEVLLLCVSSQSARAASLTTNAHATL